MSMWVILTIVSVALGFVAFTIAFAMFYYTVIPLYVAIWQAAYV